MIRGDYDHGRRAASVARSAVPCGKQRGGGHLRFPFSEFESMKPRIVASTVALAWLAACAAGVQGRAVGPDTQYVEPVVVDMANDYLSEVTVYLVRGAQYFKLGYVRTQSTTRFTVPAHVVGSGLEIRLAVAAVDLPRRSMSDVVFASSGQRLRFRVEQNATVFQLSGPE
jgi:hypothetical protein